MKKKKILCVLIFTLIWLMPYGFFYEVGFIDNLENEDGASAAKLTANLLLNPWMSEYDLEDVGILNSAQMTERGKNYDFQ